MNGPYREIPEEKREKILQAAIREFAEQGYDMASTNRIVREAGISKGLLFHYYGNKKNLFLAAYDHCQHKVAEGLLPKIPEMNGDLFERMLEIGRLKLQLFLKHPLEYRFFMEAFGNVPPDVEEEVRRRRERLAAGSWPQLLAGVDWSLFRDGVDPGRALPLIFTVLEAVGERWMKRLQDEPDKGLALLSDAMRELQEWLDLLKFGVYKPRREQEGG